MDIPSIPPSTGAHSFIFAEPSKESAWTKHLGALGLDQKQTQHYSKLLQELSKGNLSQDQLKTLELLLKKLFNIKNIYLQHP